MSHPLMEYTLCRHVASIAMERGTHNKLLCHRVEVQEHIGCVVDVVPVVIVEPDLHSAISKKEFILCKLAIYNAD